jgi:DICT domain-containing protein
MIAFRKNRWLRDDVTRFKRLAWRYSYAAVAETGAWESAFSGGATSSIITSSPAAIDRRLFKARAIGIVMTIELMT